MKSIILHLCQNTDILYIGFDFVKRFLFSLFVFSSGSKVGLERVQKGSSKMFRQWRHLWAKCLGSLGYTTLIKKNSTWFYYSIDTLPGTCDFDFWVIFCGLCPLFGLYSGGLLGVTDECRAQQRCTSLRRHVSWLLVLRGIQLEYTKDDCQPLQLHPCQRAL